MSLLYVSNPSRQQEIFMFRKAITKDMSMPQSVTIASGGQVELGHGWTREEMDYVIRQIEERGGINAAQAHGHMDKFNGLLWREEHPVDEDEIVTAHEAALDYAKERSVVQATRSVAGLDRFANSNRGKQKTRLTKSTTVEIKQQLPPHAHRTGDEVEFELTVDTEGHGDKHVMGLT